jgi:2-hydroxychromene-2-carboxylate isomerase
MSIVFYFDYLSPNAYLAWQRLPGIARHYGRKLDAVPVLFPALLEAHGQLGPAEVEPKLDWMIRNNLRKAAALGVLLNAPVVHPFNPLLLLRVTHAAATAEERTRLTAALLRAVWVDRVDPQDPVACTAYLDGAGFDGTALVEASGSPPVKDALRAATTRALAQGVFGVPSFVVDKEVFWGYDDLPQLEQFLVGRGTITSAQLLPWRECRERGVKRRGR